MYSIVKKLKGSIAALPALGLRGVGLSISGAASPPGPGGTDRLGHACGGAFYLCWGPFQALVV